MSLVLSLITRNSQLGAYSSSETSMYNLNIRRRHLQVYGLHYPDILSKFGFRLHVSTACRPRPIARLTCIWRYSNRGEIPQRREQGACGLLCLCWPSDWTLPHLELLSLSHLQPQR